MMPRTTASTGLALLLAAMTVAAVPPAQAQAVGPKPPPFEPPPRTAPPRHDGDPAPPPPGIDGEVMPNVMAPRNDVVAAFTDSYARAGRPRIAFYWNRQLSDTMGQWYADARTVATERREGGWEGDGQRQKVTENQRRAPGGDGTRPARPEPWEWAFQDGFLAPFLKADAQIMDRAAILRIMGAGAEDMDTKTVEIMALQTMADLLVEVLVADSGQSTTGYELRARMLDMRTGRVLAMVNSRTLAEWNRAAKPVATARGFEIPAPDDERFGPENDQKTVATPNGFDIRRPPPKPEIIGRNLATNVMSRLIPVMDSGTVQGSARAATVADPGPPPPPPAKARSSQPPNQSAVPLPQVDSQPLPPPAKEETPAPSADEPPMPKATRQ